MLQEKSEDQLIKKEISAVPGARKLSDRDLSKIIDYINDNDSKSLALAPGVLSSFILFAQDVGLPSSKAMIMDGLSGGRNSADSILLALQAAKIIDHDKIPGEAIQDYIHRTYDENKLIKKNPKKEIDVYSYNMDFLNSLGDVAGKLELKNEDVMDYKKIIEDIECKYESMSDDFTDHLDDEVLQKIADGMLLVLSELEAEGKIKKFDSPQDSKNALLAAIKKLYQSRGLISKEGRKLQRFGSTRVMKNAKRDIGHAMRKHESINEEDHSYVSSIKADISHAHMGKSDAAEVEFDQQSIKIEWKAIEDHRSFGIDKITPVLITRKVSLKFKTFDYSADKYSNEESVELEFPKDVDNEFKRSEDDGIKLFPSDADIVISGDPENKSSWKIESIKIVWNT